MSSHDAHYRAMEDRGERPVILDMEAEIVRNLPYEYHSTAIRNLSLAMARKYLRRAGAKGDAQQDREKAENYIYRAANGVWPWEKRP